MIKYPYILNPIFKKLEKNHIRPIIVGGFIRDFLLQIESKDIDIEIYGISSLDKLEEILQEFGNVNSVGKSFGVCKLSYANYEIDFSLPREDNKIGLGHKGFHVSTNKHLDFKDAAVRRDFTINSMGYDILNKTLLDPFNGIKDLQNKTLNAVNENTFIEDPLRILRGVQFCARFDFEMSDTLFLLCQNMIRKNMLNELSHERVYEEIKKLLLKSQTPSKGFILLKNLGALKYFSQLNSLDSHSFNSTLTTLDAITQNTMVFKLAALSYKLNLIDAIAFISHLSPDKKLLDEVLILLQNYQEIEKIYQDGLEDYSIYKLASKANIEELIQFNEAIFICEKKSFTHLQEFKKHALKLDVLNKKLPALLQGKDILEFGIKPSQIYSQILNNAYEAQMNAEFNSKNEALSWLKTHYSNLCL